MLSPGNYNDLITDMTSGNNLRSFQSLVEQRQRYAKDTAIFKGEVGLWNNFLIIKQNIPIRFFAGNSTSRNWSTT